MSIRNTLWVMLALAASTATLQGQVVRGRVLVDSTADSGIPAARIEVRGADYSRFATTDSRGNFEIAVSPGKFLMRIEALGFITVQSDTLEAAPSQRLVVRAALSANPTEIAPIIVTARQMIKTGRYGFDYRRARAQKTGVGRFLGEDELSHTNAIRLSDAIRRLPFMSRYLDASYVNARGPTTFTSTPMRGRGCSGGFVYYVNGSPVRASADEIDTMYDPSMLKGVEVYRRAWEVPGEFGGGSSGCGAIVIWTR